MGQKKKRHSREATQKEKVVSSRSQENIILLLDSDYKEKNVIIKIRILLLNGLLIKPDMLQLQLDSEWKKVAGTAFLTGSTRFTRWSLGNPDDPVNPV